METDTLDFCPGLEEPSFDRVLRPTETPTVLVVDDDEAFRELLTEFLWDAGYHVRTATDGLEAFHRVDPRIDDDGVATDIDLVVVDFYMPRMSGLELVSHLRAWSLTTPIISMSAFPSASFYRRSIELGCVGTFSKPFSFFEFLEFTDRLFDR